MPRKKLASKNDTTDPIELSNLPTSSESAQAAKKQPKSTTKTKPKAKADSAPQSVVEESAPVVTPPSEAKAKKEPKGKKGVQSEPVPPVPEIVVSEPVVQKKSAAPKKKVAPKTTPVVEEPVTPVVQEAKPAKSARPNKQTPRTQKPEAKVESKAVEAFEQPPIVQEALEEDIVVSFRPANTERESRPTQTNQNSQPAGEPTARKVGRGHDRKSSREKPRPSFRETAPTATVTEPAPILTVDESLLVGGEELPVVDWRPRTKPSAKTPTHAPKQVVVEAETDSEVSPAPSDRNSDQAAKSGRNRRRRGVPKESPKVEAPVVEEVVAKDHEEEIPRATFRRERTVPAPPSRPAIEIPAAAPQVVLRDGIPTLVRNHRVYPPLMFFGSPSDERRAAIVLDELRMAAESGVHLHSFLIDFDVDPEQVEESAGLAGYILSKAVEIDPEAQVVFRIVFQATRGWQDKYPNAKYKYEDGTVAEPSVCDDEFWTVARTCLERFIKQVRLLPLNEHILGVHLERGEWFFSEDLGYDNSKAAQVKFRDWAKTRYNNDEVTLRASWFDGAARFDNIQIPEFRQGGNEDEKFIRSSRKQRRFVDYHLFLSDATVHRIGDLAYAAKSASEGYFLVGASYGYTFEWSHPSSGHLSLGKLLRTPDIDFIAGPPSYRQRDPGGSAPFPCPIDSFALNGKLYISEEDFKTSLSIGHEPDDFNPTLKTPQALESAHWRGAGVALAHASGMAWMDLWGNGWLKTNSVWARAKKVQDVLIDRMQTPLTDPEVAIFIDERALAYLVDTHAFELLVQNVRESVLRAGVSAAFYLLSDLAHREKFPDSKLYLFLNSWDVRPELRAAIKSRLQCNGKVLFWLYSAGLFDAGRDSLERAREVTGIALKPQPFYSKSGTTILNRRHPLSEAFPDKSLIGTGKLEPSNFAIPEGGTVLGEYSQTGLPSFVVREFNEGPAETHWTSVFLGEPVVNAALIRALAQMAGAHVWNFQEDVVHVRAPFCTVHCSGAGPRALTLPNKYSAYNLLTNEWAAVDSTNLRFTATDGSTHVFLVGPKEDLLNILERDPSTALTMADLPKREANILGDISNFDVPIMKLDEWMEGGDSEEASEDWFLRPQQIVEEPEPEDDGSDKIGRRRRRRRGRPERGGTEESSTGRREHTSTSITTEFGDLGMNVMFRKRE